MVPGKADGEADRDRSDRDRTLSESDQARADSDQAAADRDQVASDDDQLAADEDQAASDREFADGGDREAHDHSQAVRDRTGRARLDTARARDDTALERDASANARDRAAAERDAMALARDLEAADQDAEFGRLICGDGSHPARLGEQVMLRAARDRQNAAGDRELAARDRVHAAMERNAAAVDALTGAWQRGPGLSELEHEIARARRGNGQLIAAFVDVNGLKAINDSQGHRAGDALLINVVAALRAHLRPYELVVRVGGDEFLCVLADASLDDVRRRFDGIADHLSASVDAGPITVGFAELSAQDSATDLMERADQDYLTAHNARQ